jgi:hypothetical protein
LVRLPPVRRRRCDNAHCYGPTPWTGGRGTPSGGSKVASHSAPVYRDQTRWARSRARGPTLRDQQVLVGLQRKRGHDDPRVTRRHCQKARTRHGSATRYSGRHRVSRRQEPSQNGRRDYSSIGAHPGNTAKPATRCELLGTRPSTRIASSIVDSCAPSLTKNPGYVKRRDDFAVGRGNLHRTKASRCCRTLSSIRAGCIPL